MEEIKKKKSYARSHGLFLGLFKFTLFIQSCVRLKKEIALKVACEKVVSSNTCDFFDKIQKLVFIVPVLIVDRYVFSTLYHLGGIPDMLDYMQILLLKYVFFYLTVCTHICQHWCNKDQLSDCLKFCASRMIWGIPKMWSYLYRQSNLARL